MRPSARLQASIELLDEIIVGARDNGAAADTIARKFFAKRRYAGSKDRRAIRDLTWKAIRQFGERPRTARAAFVAMSDNDPEIAALFDGSPYGPDAVERNEIRATSGSLPGWIMPYFSKLLDKEDKASLLGRAPLDIRLNPSKTDAKAISAAFEEAKPLEILPTAFRLPTGFQLEQHEIYKNGDVEIQDFGSQLIVDACKANSNMCVIDLCAGAGGKTLGLAEAMRHGDEANMHGQIIAADTNRNRLDQLKPRAERAGCEDLIERILLNPNEEREMLSQYNGKADLVLVDAPCSGSGTWRRNPETRWRLTGRRLELVKQQQSNILDIAADLVKEGGHLVFAVCSLLEGEGEAQIDAFLSRHNGWKPTDIEQNIGRRAGKGILLTPAKDKTDGFFFARMQKL